MTENISKIAIEAYLKGYESGLKEGVELVRKVVRDGYSATNPMIEKAIEQAMIQLREENGVGSVHKETTDGQDK